MKYVYVFAALVAVLLIFAGAAADAAMIHRCRFPDGHYEDGPCPARYKGKPAIVNCHTWKQPHKYRHGGWCKTAG